MPAAGRAACAIAEILRKGGVVLLYSSRGTRVAVTHRPVDHIKAALPLIQSQLVVGRQGRVSKIHCAPFNVEYPVGRSARYRGENTAGAPWVTRAANPTQIIRALVVPVREHRVVVAEPWQANVGKVGGRGRELSRPIGRYIDARERRVVQRE